MGLVPQVAAERRPCPTRKAAEVAAIAERLGGRHYADRRDKTLFMELIDLRLRQDFGHGHCASGATDIRNMLDRQRPDEAEAETTATTETAAGGEPEATDA